MITQKLNIKVVFDDVANVRTYQDFVRLVQRELKESKLDVARLMFEIFLGIHYEEAMDYKKVLCKSFNNPIEKILYAVTFDVQEEIQEPNYDWGNFFTTFWGILFELDDYEHSAMILNMAINWNPFNTAAYFELGEIYKMQNNWARYLDFNQMAFRTITNVTSLSRYYRNLSFYYIEQNELQKAANLLAYSASYEYHPLIDNELLYIHTLDNEIRPDWFMNTKEYLKSENISTEPSELVIDVIHHVITEFKRVGESEVVEDLERELKSLKIRTNVDQSLRNLYYPKN